MSKRHAPPPRPLREMNRLAPPPRQLSKQRTWSPDMLLQEAAPPPRQPGPLCKQRSWSPDMHREEAWQRRRQENRQGCSDLRRGNTVTNGDLEELKACIELGFGFDSPEMDPKLAETLPALGLYYAVNKQLSLSRSSSSSSLAGSDAGSSSSVIDTGDDPETVKTRLKQWAQVVACSVRQSSGSTDLRLE